MFHFPAFPPHHLYIQRRVTRHHSCWVSPFGHPRITARLTAPRGLSQPPTSFIGSWYQGIHHAPLKTYTQKPRKKDARVHYADLKQQTHNQHLAPPTPTHNKSQDGTTPAGRERQQTKRPVPSGPNSAPHQPPHPATPVPPPTGEYQTRNTTRQPAIVSVPPTSNRRRTHAGATATGPPTKRWTATCSLERR